MKFLHKIQAKSNKYHSFQLKPKQLDVVPFHVKTSPTAQGPLEFQVEVVSDEVHHKLSSSVELNVNLTT